MATRDELRNAVLSKLGCLDGSAAPDADDATRVNTEVQQVLEALYDDGLIPFDLDSDAIPAAYMTPLSFLIAQELIADYGAMAREQTIMAGAERGRRRLYQLKAPPDYGLPTTAVYY